MKSKKIKIIIRILKIFLAILVTIILGAVIVQRLSNNKVMFLDRGIYTIISESMVPEYEIGDMFIAKKVKKEDIKVGDDIVYIGTVDSYKDKVVTHRVVRIDNKIHTKGINNSMEDPAIDYEQVYGKVTTRLILLSTFSKIMNNNGLFYVIVFVPLTMLIFLDLRAIVEDKKELEMEKNKAKEENKTNTEEVKEENKIIEETKIEENKNIEENKIVDDIEILGEEDNKE